MKLILTLIMMSSVTLAMQTCSKSGTATKADSKTSTTTSSDVAANKTIMTPAPMANAEDDAPRINLEEAKEDFDKGNAVFIDTRGEESYNVEHIKGSLNIPLNLVETRYKELPKDKKIIAYCS